jgi:hypothetical protein
MTTPLTFDDLYTPQRRSTVRERAAEVGVRKDEAEAPYAGPKARADVASAEATAEEKRALLPARTRTAEAGATIAEAKAAQAEIALQKARSEASSLPGGERVPEAREMLLREIRNLAQARELSEDMFSASGVGYRMLEGFSGSPAATVAGLLQPIASNEAFDRLQRMRAESPTGGALGAVSNIELDLLKSSGGFTPPTAGDKAFQQGVDDLITKRIKVLNRLGVSPGELAQAVGPRYVEKFAPMVESYRFRKEDEQALDNYVKTNMAEGTFDPTDFAALMSQAYYNATGNQPDDAYITSAFESALAIQDEGRTSLGSLEYGQPDTDAREVFLQAGKASAPEEMGLGEALGGAALNFIPSTFELAADTVQALTLDLPQTLEGVAQIVGGATGLSDPAAWEAVKDYFGERYGSYAGFKRALRDDPASIAADVAGVATGGALLTAKTASTAGRVSKIATLSEAAKKAEDFGTIAAKLDPLNTAVSLGTTAAKTGARTAENLGVALPAKLLGVQTADVKQAADAGRRGSQTFLDSLEGRAPPEDAIAKAQNALSELYQSRSAEYTRRMARTKKQPETLAFDDVEKAIEGVRTVGRHKGIDISGASGVWSEVDAKVMEFFDKGLNTIEDFDAMKRAVGNIRDKYQRGTPEYKVANDVTRAINSTITAKAPVYANIMNDYRVASDTLADIQSSLSMGAKSGDTTLGKLRRTASERGPRGRTILDLLESTEAGKGLGDMLSGQNLSATEPSGLGATAGAVGAVGMADPTLTAASAASPQMLGKAAYKFGQGQALFDSGREAVANLPGAQQLAELAQRYSGPAREGVRVANPALIQPMVNPVEMPEADARQQSLDEILASYNVAAPAMRGASGQINLSDLASKYSGPALADTAMPQTPQDGMPTQQGSIKIGDREVRYDPEEDAFFDAVTGEKLEGYKQGGRVGGFARAVAEGATFGYNDNIEARLRTLFDRDPEAYKRTLNEIRRAQAAFEDENPGLAITGNMLGAVGTAFVPGAQGLSAARVAAMGPKARAAYELALGTAQGAAYGTGKMHDYPDSDRDPLAVFISETAGGAAGYPVARGAAAAGKKASNYIPPEVKSFAARKGRELTNRFKVRPSAGR